MTPLGVSFRHTTWLRSAHVLPNSEITSAPGKFWATRKLNELSTLNRIRERERHRRNTADKHASDRNKSVVRFGQNCADQSQFHTSTAYRDGRRRSRTGSRRARSSVGLARLVLVPAVRRLRESRSKRGRSRLRYPPAPSSVSTSAISFCRTQQSCSVRQIASDGNHLELMPCQSSMLSQRTVGWNR
jgi:hypothetical protein